MLQHPVFVNIHILYVKTYGSYVASQQNSLQVYANISSKLKSYLKSNHYYTPMHGIIVLIRTFNKNNLYESYLSNVAHVPPYLEHLLKA